MSIVAVQMRAVKGSPCPLWIKSGHVRCKTECPLRAKSGHRDTYSITSLARVTSDGGTVRQGQKRTLLRYSITSSAMESTLAGMVRPSALAVVRLMTNSNLVVCSTGRSAGLAPLRMVPA